NGGQLQFGPDRFLYIGMGDGGSGGDPMNRGQNKGELLGKILRINVDDGFPYEIPPGNPFLHEPGVKREIWALGLRNPWRFSFDRETGDMFIADVGQDNFEEINFQSFSSHGGENYGWNRMEGNACFDPKSNCNDGTLILPILEYDHSGGNCSVTGGYRYRGIRSPTLAGLYFFADYCSGRIWAGTQGEAGKWTQQLLLDSSYNISTFGEDEEGEIYLTHLDENEGAVFHLVAAKTPQGN
ncbi:MAG: PQQ-dependent sugar dehydrogenase, partial [Nitrospinales bacterium]